MSYNGLGKDVASTATTASGTVSGTQVAVQTVQAWLQALGYSVRIDGVWGSQTGTALSQFAARKGTGTPLFAVVNANRTLVFSRSDDPLLKALRIDGTAAIRRRQPAPDGSTPPPAPVEPLPSPEEPSILVRDSIISGVPNWAIFGGVAAVAGYFAWKRSKKAA